MSGLDWPGLMRAGLRGLGLKPKDFWQLSPMELMLMLGRDDGSAPLSRSRMDELTRAFPDQERGVSHE